MDGIKRRGGLKPWEKDGERNFFTSLLAEMKQASLNLESDGAKGNMTQLMSAVDQVLLQLM